MNPSVYLRAFAAVLLIAATARAAKVPYRLGERGLEIEGVGSDCPMIYDNDWWCDVPDAAYIWAKASLGQCDLKGNIITRCTFGWEKGYAHKLEEQVRDCHKLLKAARDSGLRNIPDPILGATEALRRPDSGKIEDTKFTRSKGSDLVVAEARKASKEKPLLIFVGGSCTTVATAYLTDPAIAERTIVFQIDGGGYNGSDGWAWEIAMKRCRFANWAKGYFWDQVSEWKPERFKSLPKNPLGDLLRAYATVGHGKANQWGDGAWVFYTFDHRCLTKAEDYEKAAITVPREGTNVKRMEDEFFATMTNPAVYQPARAPASAKAKEENAIKTPYPAKVSTNRRYLLDQYGKPFFWLGDTAWELFHRLNREEAEHYLKDRAAKKFTVIQAVVLAELGGLDVPNPYGHLPLKDKDPTKPIEDYFKHVDFVVNKADELGLVIGMLPTWGDKWHDGRKGGIFTPENAAVYGEFLGKRYRDKPIVWILGGDRSIDNERHKAILRTMAAGLKKGDGGRHLMTLHPPGGRDSAEWFHEDDWLAFNMLQTGHGYNHDNYNRISRCYQRRPAKPCLDGEPSYEDHPAEFNAKNGYTSDYDVRKGAYWALFAGACGHTYGCHDIWQFFAEGRNPITAARTPWRKALQLPGAGQMRHARTLLESRPFLQRIPDQSLLISDADKGGDRVQATRSEDGSYAFIYSASGKPFTVDLSKLSGKELVAHWYDPRTGIAAPAGKFPRGEGRKFEPPTQGKDWVLTLDDAAKNYPAPGATRK
jgi:hypothetical protein